MPVIVAPPIVMGAWSMAFLLRQHVEYYHYIIQELLKYTSDDHPDRPHVEAAVEAMRQVATHINESKRRLENIGRIGKWQESIDGWKVCVCVCSVCVCVCCVLCIRRCMCVLCMGVCVCVCMCFGVYM